MSQILNEYGSLILAMLAVIAMFIVYGAILDKGRLQFVYYNASPFSEYNADIDAEEVQLGKFEYGQVADDVYSVFNIGRDGMAKAPWFHVGSNSQTTLPLKDTTVPVYKPGSEAAARDLVKEFFIDGYDIDIKTNGTTNEVDVEDLLLVEYQPELNQVQAPDGTLFDAGVKYEWGYCLDEYGNRIRAEEDADAEKVAGDLLVEDNGDFDLETVVDEHGYLLIPVTRYARYLYVDKVDYTDKGGDSVTAAGRDLNPNGIYAEVKEFKDFELQQDKAVRYKVIYRTEVDGMKAQHIALFRNTVRTPSMLYPDT